jgi:outer membrane protein
MTMTTQNKTINLQLNKTVKRFAIPVLALLLFSVQFVAAQERTITLDEALKLGVANSNQVKLSKAKIDQAVAQYEQAKDNVLPTGKASFTYDRAEIPANKLDFGSLSFGLPKNDNAYLGIADINETIFGGGKLRYAQQSTELLAQAARADADNDKDAVAYDIITQFYNLYKVLQSKKVVEANIATIDEQIKQSQRFLDQGIVTKNDVLRFQLQRANIELNGIDLETNRKIVNFNLNVLLGLADDTQLNIVDIDEAARDIPPAANYIDTALINRSELRSMDFHGKAADINVKNVQANILPSVVASGAAYYIGTNIDPLPKSGNYILPITVGVGISWNYSALWTNKNKVTEAKIEREEIDYNRALTVNNIRREVNNDYQNYVMSRDKIKLLQTSIDQATENNKILISKYQSNVASATDKADAQTLLYQAQISLELAKADAGLAYYTLLKSTGKLNK